MRMFLAIRLRTRQRRRRQAGRESNHTTAIHYCSVIGGGGNELNGRGGYTIALNATIQPQIHGVIQSTGSNHDPNPRVAMLSQVGEPPLLDRCLLQNNITLLPSNLGFTLAFCSLPLRGLVASQHKSSTRICFGESCGVLVRALLLSRGCACAKHHFSRYYPLSTCRLSHKHNGKKTRLQHVLYNHS